MASIAPAFQNDALDQIFAGLKNKSHEVRVQSATDLQRYVRHVVPSLSFLGTSHASRSGLDI